jgi:virginiamycin B lyase
MKPRLAGSALVALLPLLLLSTTAAARPFGPVRYLEEPYSLGAPSARVRALVSEAGRRLWFAGEASDRHSPPFGIAGSLGPLGFSPDRTERIEPAAAALAQGKALDGIALGPDGNVWITSAAGDKILRLTPSGTLDTYPVAVPGSASAALGGPTGIVVGPDGALWFTAETGDAIGRISANGEFRAWRLAAGAAPHAIALGADGRLWFTEAGAAAIGAITAGGRLSTYPLPRPRARPNGIAAGPEGAIWFTEANSPHIGKVTRAGGVTEFEAEAAGPIIAGPEGVLWFGSRSGIGSISPRGALGSTFCLDNCHADVEALALGPNRALWYAAGDSVGEYSTPWPELVAAHRGRLSGQDTVRIPISCGGVAGERCRGAARLRVDGHLWGTAGFDLAVGRTRDLVMRLRMPARRYLAHHRKAKARLYFTVAFTLRQEATVTLQSGVGGNGHADRR